MAIEGGGGERRRQEGEGVHTSTRAQSPEKKEERDIPS